MINDLSLTALFTRLSGLVSKQTSKMAETREEHSAYVPCLPSQTGSRACLPGPSTSGVLSQPSALSTAMVAKVTVSMVIQPSYDVISVPESSTIIFTIFRFLSFFVYRLQFQNETYTYNVGLLFDFN